MWREWFAMNRTFADWYGAFVIGSIIDADGMTGMWSNDNQRQDRRSEDCLAQAIGLGTDSRKNPKGPTAR